MSKIEMAVLHADFDDAFVAYLNGTEIARGNLSNAGPAPAFNVTPLVEHEAEMYNGGLPEAYLITPNIVENLMELGQNTLAIQIHNVDINSSDLSSNFFLSNPTFQYLLRTQ